jgi:hypothetical protein
MDGVGAEGEICCEAFSMKIGFPCRILSNWHVDVNRNGVVGYTLDRYVGVSATSRRVERSKLFAV